MNDHATNPRRFVWYRARVRLDTGLTDYRGRLLLSSLTEDGAGFIADPSTVHAVRGTQLDACRRIWGDERDG